MYNCAIQQGEDMTLVDEIEDFKEEVHEALDVLNRNGYILPDKELRDRKSFAIVLNIILKQRQFGKESIMPMDKYFQWVVAETSEISNMLENYIQWYVDSAESYI